MHPMSKAPGTMISALNCNMGNDELPLSVVFKFKLRRCMMQACYYNYSPEVVAALLDAGVGHSRDDAAVREAAIMARRCTLTLSNPR